MVFLTLMLDKINFKEKVEGCIDLPQPGSNWAYYPLSVIESFLMSKRHGANRFMYTEITRHVQGLKKYLEGFRLRHKMSVNGIFQSFPRLQTRLSVTILFMVVWYCLFWNYTLDFDSPELTRYGEQEGSKRGNNPHKQAWLLIDEGIEISELQFQSPL